MNRLLLTVGLAAMHVCWVYPWSLLLVRWLDGAPDQAVLGAWSMLALVLLGALTAWLVIRFVGIRRPGQLALVTIGVLAALFVVRLHHFTEHRHARRARIAVGGRRGHARPPARCPRSRCCWRWSCGTAAFSLAAPHPPSRTSKRPSAGTSAR